MNPNSFRHRCIGRRSLPFPVSIELSEPFATLFAELSVTAHRLSIVAATERSDRGLVPEGCRALDRVAELPELARGTAYRADIGVVEQADRLSSVAAYLASLLRSAGIGFRDEAGPFRGATGERAAGHGSGLGDGLAELPSLGPNETNLSLILVAETLSLAAQLILVLARLDRRRGRECRALRLFECRVAGPAVRWTGRVVALLLSTDLIHLWPMAWVAVWALVMLAVLTALIRRRAASHPVRIAADLLGVAASVALPHAVLVVLALAEFATRNRPGHSPRRATGRDERSSAGCVGFTSQPRRARRDRREHHRDQ